VEAALLEQDAVREAVVVDREDTPGNRRLVAYVTPHDGETVRNRDLRAAMQARLPQYMVPSAFVVLDELPLTPHGKIDRAALPVPGAARLELEKSHVAPRNSVEEVLANIWKDILDVESVSIHENFFDLGGHSLLAMQLVSRMRENFGIDVPIAAVFSAPTVSRLGECLLQDPSNRQALEKTAELILRTAHLSDDELEALVDTGLAA
jgi:acyl carrier protein